jgi:hypothetical protein
MKSGACTKVRQKVFAGGKSGRVTDETVCLRLRESLAVMMAWERSERPCYVW